MLHWPSGLSSDFPEPSRELSPCDTPSLHHSITPLFHYSVTPLLDHLRPHSRQRPVPIPPVPSGTEVARFWPLQSQGANTFPTRPRYIPRNHRQPANR